MTSPPANTAKATFKGIIVPSRMLTSTSEGTLSGLTVPRRVLADFLNPATPPLEMTKDLSFRPSPAPLSFRPSPAPCHFDRAAASGEIYHTHQLPVIPGHSIESGTNIKGLRRMTKPLIDSD